MEDIILGMPSKTPHGLEPGYRSNWSESPRQTGLRQRSAVKRNAVEPFDPDLEVKLKQQGLSQMTIQNEEDQVKVIKLIRSMPKPLSVKKSMKQMLLAGPIKSTKGFTYSMKAKWRSFKLSWNEFKYKMTVWRKSLKKIEGHQGTAVVSYFVFLRWLLFLDIFIFLLLFWVVTFFQVTFDNDGFSSSLVDTTTREVKAEQCSGVYNVTAESNALSRILDFIQGTGWMEPTVLFYGAYTNQNLKLAISQYNMPLAYFVVSVLVMLISLIVMVHNTISNFKDHVLSREARAKTAYCNSVFASMNYGIMDEDGMNSKQKSIYILIYSELEEQRYDQLSLKRSGYRKCAVYTLRVIINFIIVILLVGAGAAIYFAQKYSSDFTTKDNIDDKNEFLVLFIEFLPSIVIGALNGIYPLLFELLVWFENYRPATVVKLTLIRIVFLRLASLVMIIISIYIQITCSDHDSCNVGRNNCPSIQCWETYVGSSVYKLIISDFLVDVAMTLGVELARKCITTRSENGCLKKIGPALFDVPKSVLDLVYLQTLLWLGFFFAPLLPAVVVCSLFFKFYLKKLSALYNTIPPEKPYLASRSNEFFTVILMVAYFMICIPVGYALVELEPSPMCGPFRSYYEPSYIMEIQIDNGPSGFQTVWKIITSSASVAAIILLLCLALYYCSQLNSAHKELIVMLREQLVLEGKDKQFLLSRVNELAGTKGSTPKDGLGKKVDTPKKGNKDIRNGTAARDMKDFRNGSATKTTDNVPNGHAKTDNNDLQQQQELPLYGKEEITVHTPVNDAPPPANYVDHPPPKTRSPITVKNLPQTVEPTNNSDW